MLLIVMHTYLCMRIALASQHAWCHSNSGTASCKHPEPTYCLYMCVFTFTCHQGYHKLLDRPLRVHNATASGVMPASIDA